MSKIYSASFTDVAVAAAQDLFSLLVGDDEPIHLMGFIISQNTEFGDAAAEQLTVNIIRGWGTVGTGGTAPAALNLDGKGGAATTTVRANDTTEASSGTDVLMHSECWNVRMPLIYMPIPELRIRVDQADDILSVSLITVPDDSITASGTIYWQEI